MKKLWPSTALLLLSMPCFGESGWSVDSHVGYKVIPGSYFYKERVEQFINGSSLGLGTEQGQRGATLNMFAARIAFMRPVKGIRLGVETGLDFPIQKTVIQWVEPATDGLTAVTRFPSEASGLDRAETILSKEITTWAFPLLLKTSVAMGSGDKWSVQGNLAFGGYITVQTIDTSRTNIYQFPSGVYQVGDRRIVQGSRETFTSVNPMVEFRPETVYKLSDDFNLSFWGELGYIPKFGPLTELDQNIKTAYEFGGLTYGFGLGFHF